MGVIEDMDDDIAAQERWGMSRTDMAVKKAARLLRLAAAHMQQQDDEIAALEARVAALEAKVP